MGLFVPLLPKIQQQTSICHPSKCSQETAPKIAFILADRIMALFMFRFIFFLMGEAILGILAKFRSYFLPSLPRHPLTHDISNDSSTKTVSHVHYKLQGQGHSPIAAL